MDTQSYYGGGGGSGCPSWVRVGSASSDITSAMALQHQQQQRFYYPMSLNNIPKNKATGGGGVGYQDYRDRYPQQQQYAGTDSNGTDYYGSTRFFAKPLQQSAVPSGVKRRRLGGTFPKKVSNSDGTS